MERSDTNNSGVGETQLDAQLQSYFDRQRSTTPVPDFDAMLALAAQQAWPGLDKRTTLLARLFKRGANPDQIYWGAGAVAAVLVVTVIYLVSGTGTLDHQLDESVLAGLPDEVAMTQQDLVADISRTTHWRAPSDQWLRVGTMPDLLGLPEMGDPYVSARILKEKS